ncbi:flagellar export protein FliJ [Paenibacillus sp. XY044]|uniref:flagellar export protein FliJ n=1 Tax=Paenibacillus sp. XY044 TaxID=2026089 RepID=UPI000B99117E|nr:flagellar export protein FliJ [Paenibacillus sp. XY044]OZB97800.1 flagellar export protein FliJ [Paenibacillus sp. XY044]
MRFQYAFQKIVDLKSNERTQAEWMLSSAIGKLQAEEKSLGELLDIRENMAKQLQEAAGQCVPVSMIQEIQAYVEYLDQCIRMKHVEVNRANMKVQMQQNHLSTKMLDENVWLKARDKAKTAFQQQALLHEQNELDEMATVRFAMSARAR